MESENFGVLFVVGAVREPPLSPQKFIRAAYGWAQNMVNIDRENLCGCAK